MLNSLDELEELEELEELVELERDGLELLPGYAASLAENNEKVFD